MNYTGTKEYTGKGQGIYNTVAASIGAANALFGGNGCGNNGGLLNLNGNNNECCYETKESAILRTQLAIAESNAKTAETSKQDLERFYTVVRNTDEKIADGLIQTGNALGVLTAKVDCLEQSVARNREESFRNLQEAKGYTDTSVMSEAQLRKCGDENGKLWVQAQNYIPAVLRVDSDQICGASPLSNGCDY